MAQTPSTIRFEDATGRSGIQFTHSFGAQQLGSLLEGAGQVVSGSTHNDGFPRPLRGERTSSSDGMHPYPLEQPPASATQSSLPQQRRRHVYRRHRPGRRRGRTSMASAAIAADFDNDGFVDLFVTGYGRAILYHNQRRRHL